MLGLLTFLALLTAGAGLAGTYFGYFSSELAFLVVGAGAGLASLSFLLCFFLMLAGKRTSWLSILFGLPAAAGIGFLGYQHFKVPMSDVSTDLVNPPKFSYPVFPFKVDKGAEYLDPSLAIARKYDDSASPAQIRLAPDLENIKAKVPGPDAFAQSVKLIKAQLPDWKFLAEDAKAMHAEITFMQPPLNLENDVALEVRFDSRMPNDAEIALRCRARLPYADLGVCLATVEDLKARLAAAMKTLEGEMAHKASAAPAADAAAKATGTATGTAPPPPTAPPAPAAPANAPPATAGAASPPEPAKGAPAPKAPPAPAKPAALSPAVKALIGPILDKKMDNEL